MKEKNTPGKLETPKTFLDKENDEGMVT